MIQIGDNFDHKSKKPLDNRTQYATLAAMKAVTDANIPEGCEAYCVATDKYYKFLSSNTVDSTTGKWRERESGGASTLTDLTDTTISSPSNGQVLSYDSATSKWKNTAASGGASSLNDLSDVTITSATNGQILMKGADEWINANMPQDSTKQPKTLDTPLEINGQTITTVEGALAALNSIASTEGVTRLNVSLDTLPCGVRNGIVTYYWNATVGTAPTTYGVPGLEYDTSNLLKYDYDVYVTVGCCVSEGNMDQYTEIAFVTERRTSYQGTLRIYTRGYYASYPTSYPNNWVKKYDWMEVSGGSEVDTTKLYSTDDTAETALADADYVPFYDTSATTKKKTLWSNIKSVLKTYFDTLYSGIFTNATELAKIGEQGGTPTYDGQIISLPTVHNFDKANLYSTTEQVVGKWTDGRPIYQCTYSGTTPSTWASSTADVTLSVATITNIKVINAIGYLGGNADGSSSTTVSYIPLPVATNSYSVSILWSSGTVYLFAKGALQYFKSQPYSVTIQYTKNADAANSFNYASENDYSTSETIIGTWINGKTLYQRTVTGTSPSSTATSVNTGFSACTVVGYKLILGVGTDYYINDTFFQATTNSYSALLKRDGTQIWFAYNDSTNVGAFKSKPFILTIQYTKS